MSELPTREAKELVEALRTRSAYSTGQKWEWPATVAMMREAADMIERLSSVSLASEPEKGEK